VATVTAEMKMTDRRRAMLRVVVEDRVQYDPAVAIFYVDNEPVGNWDFRTLSELRSAKMIEPEAAKILSRVKITELGAAQIVSVDSPDQLG